jgi:hypothetical protein
LNCINLLSRTRVKKYFSEPYHEFAQIEKKMHHYFSENRKKGEWFDIQFDEGVITLKALLILNKMDKVHEEPIYFPTVRELLEKKFDNPSINLMPDLKPKRRN